SLRGVAPGRGLVDEGAGGDAVEEVHEARFQIALRSDDEEAVVQHAVLQERRAVAELVGGGSHVRAYGDLLEARAVFQQLRLRQVGPRRANALDDGLQVPRRWVLRLEDRVDGRLDGAAVAVSHDDDEARAEMLDGEFDAPDLRGRDDVAGDPDDEEIA